MIEVVYNLFQAQNLATGYGLSYALLSSQIKQLPIQRGINSVIKHRVTGLPETTLDNDNKYLI